MAYTININNNNTNGTAPVDASNDLGYGFRLIKDKTHRYTPATEHDISLKGIIIGDSSVGKSSLTYRFTDNTFSPSFISTIGVDFKTVVLEKESKIVKLSLWDTAGQDRFTTIVQGFFRGVHACMLVFALDDAESFENITEWIKRARVFGSDNMSFVLIGNKLDIVQRNPGLRQVATEAGQNLAQSLGCEYIETSAKDDNNVGRAFAALADVAVKRRFSDASLNPNSVRNPVKRIQLGSAHQQNAAANNNNGGKPLCAGRCG